MRRCLILFGTGLALAMPGFADTGSCRYTPAPDELTAEADVEGHTVRFEAELADAYLEDFPEGGTGWEPRLSQCPATRVLKLSATMDGTPLPLPPESWISLFNVSSIETSVAGAGPWQLTLTIHSGGPHPASIFQKTCQFGIENGVLVDPAYENHPDWKFGMESCRAWYAFEPDAAETQTFTRIWN